MRVNSLSEGNMIEDDVQASVPTLAQQLGGTSLREARFGRRTVLGASAGRDLGLALKDADTLEVTEVTIAEDGTVTSTVVATIPLTGNGQGGTLGPMSITCTVGDTTVDVGVALPASAVASTVQARIYPQGPASSRRRSPHSTDGAVELSDTHTPPSAVHVQDAPCTRTTSTRHTWRTHR